MVIDLHNNQRMILMMLLLLLLMMMMMMMNMMNMMMKIKIAITRTIFKLGSADFAWS